MASKINQNETDSGDFGGTLLPVQYYQLIRRHAPLGGEMRLLYAVLEDAMRCYLTTYNARSRYQRIRFIEARNWFEPRPSWAPAATGLFAFEPLCEALEIDPQAVRKFLATMTVADVPTRRHRRTTPSAIALPRRRPHGQRRISAFQKAHLAS